MKVFLLGFLSFLSFFSVSSYSAEGCPGKVSRLYAESNGDLYFALEPNGRCTCNFTDSFGKGFYLPAQQENHQEAYSMLMAALISDRDVSVWFDWKSGTANETRCIAHNVSMWK
ncbi:hypothetical protein [Marinibactrum halimedae]|nr:hypothetical protein [Marinibactrum halimedae]MCD9459771.1 hypothetical protein [Marinibactrum halimedae]